MILSIASQVGFPLGSPVAYHGSVAHQGAVAQALRIAAGQRWDLRMHHGVNKCRNGVMMAECL
jgi:hypothetical protein